MSADAARFADQSDPTRNRHFSRRWSEDDEPTTYVRQVGPGRAPAGLHQVERPEADVVFRGWPTEVAR